MGFAGEAHACGFHGIGGCVERDAEGVAERARYSSGRCGYAAGPPGGASPPADALPGKTDGHQPRVARYSPEKVNADESLVQLSAWAPEVIVVVAYGQFLGKRLLDLPPLGCINIHLSLLPRHRGAAPVQWAIASGDAISGVTAIRMDQGMDSGAILGQVREPVHPDDNADALYDRLTPLGAELLVRTLAELAAGCLQATPQDASGVTFAPKLKKEDGLIDWTTSAGAIARRVRAFNPWPSCFTTLPARLRTGGLAGRIKVLRADVAPPVVSDHPAGAWVACGADGLVVQTGDGTLRLLTVQLEGGKPLDGHAFLCGHALWPGDVFGR
ncbi:MAG: methionyl-tRNA formyltransferase [Kiritimatiellia bacterium]